jgi:hypothetical protein
MVPTALKMLPTALEMMLPPLEMGEQHRRCF